jgi:hypothetical protein
MRALTEPGGLSTVPRTCSNKKARVRRAFLFEWRRGCPPHACSPVFRRDLKSAKLLNKIAVVWLDAFTHV